MSILSAVYDHLTDDATVYSIVGNNIYSNVADSSTPAPYIVMRLISQLTMHHLLGVTGVKRARLQIDCYTAGSTSRTTLKNAVESRLDGWIGSTDGLMGDEGLDVRSVMLDNDSDSFESFNEASAEGLYRNRADYVIVYKP